MTTSAPPKKDTIPLDEQIPWLKDMMNKLITIGVGRPQNNGDELEQEFVDFLKEFIGLFQMKIMAKYGKSKKENKRTKLAIYLQDVISKINLFTFLLDNREESKRRRLNYYFGPLFKMYIELIAESTLSKRLGTNGIVHSILTMGKNLFSDDIDVILDVFIIADIPKVLQNSLLLAVLSENFYFSATGASFYKYLVVAKIMKERFSETSTINGIDQILSSSIALIPNDFESYLTITTSIMFNRNSMDLMSVVNKIDSAGAREDSFMKFFDADPNVLLFGYGNGNPTTSVTGFCVDSQPDSALFQGQEVIEATPDPIYEKDVEIDLKELDFNNTDNTI